MPCRDPLTLRNVKAHPARQHAAEEWYTTPSPDGLTPQRRDEMVEQLTARLSRRGEVGRVMERVTRAEDPEQQFQEELLRTVRSRALGR